MTDHQVDLFLDQLVDAPIKDERSLMEFPFFSLQKRPRTEPFIYDDGAVQITIDAGSKGIATIWDKDILIYLASLVNDRIERGAPVDRTIQFAAYDFMRVTGRGTGKRAYELFLDALHRLRSTNIQTTIMAGGETDRRGFGWIEDWHVFERTNRHGKKVMAGVEVTLNRWMFNSIVKDRRVLTINRDYFGLTMGLERRLYELARKHVGSQQEWFIGLSRLAEKCGTTGSLRKFKYRISEISKRKNIPDYSLELIDSDAVMTPFKTRQQPLVRFTPQKTEPTIEVKSKPKTKTTSAPAQDVGKPGRVSIHTYEKARELFPGYSIDFLEDRWQGWTMSKGEQLKNPDKAFLAWCRTYTTNNPL
jgi:plasmid replication initiation protein